MTFSNVSFLFGWCGVKVQHKFRFLQIYFTFQSYRPYTISIACFGTCSYLSQPPAFWWLTVQAGGTEYPSAFFLFRGYCFLCGFLFKKKARIPAYPNQNTDLCKFRRLWRLSRHSLRFRGKEYSRVCRRHYAVSERANY